MARNPSPWYRSERNEWWVRYQGTDHNLGKHPDDAPKPKRGKTGWNTPKPILDVFHALLNGKEPTIASVDAEVVVGVLDDFLEWCQENRAKKTYDRYKEFMLDFTKSYGRIPVSSLTSRHVTDWLATKSQWNGTTKRNAITALMRGFNWAVKNRGLDKNPIKGMEKPQAKKRTTFLTPEQFQTLLDAVSDQPFRDLLIVSYDSGARPFEIKDMEARHLQLDKHRAVIPASEAKGRRHPRTVYFPTDRAMEIINRLTTENPSGPLFVNRKGNKWTAMAVKCRFEDLDHVLGFRVTQYMLRHSRITDWLASGVDSHVVAKLSGHQDSRMIDTTYSHVQDDYEYMLNQAKRKAN